MIRYPKFIRFLSLLVLYIAVAPLGATDVLEHLPHNTLAALRVHPISRADERIAWLAKTIHQPRLGPLRLLGAIGIESGLDTEGELCVALLPGESEVDRPLVAVWLPVSDYDLFVTSLGGDPAEHITVVTIAGQDLLAARYDQWVLVMDHNHRWSMEQILDSRAAGRLFALNWKTWIDKQDVTLLITPVGTQRFSQTLLADETEGDQAFEKITEWVQRFFGRQTKREEAMEDDPFGDVAGGANPPGKSWLQSLGQWIRDSEGGSLGMFDLGAVPFGGACGLAIDTTGNVTVSLRVTPYLGRNKPKYASEASPLYVGGDFIVAGSGRVPAGVAPMIIGVYAQALADAVEHETGGQPNRKKAALFQQSIERATAHVGYAAVLTRPCKAGEAVFTNRFLVVRVPNSLAWVDMVDDTFDRWNNLARSAAADSGLMFEKETIQLAGREARQYSLDIGALVGGETLPEVRESMEKLFGPGGDLSFQVVELDEHTVLMTSATSEQIILAMTDIKQGEPLDRTAAELRTAGDLLPEDAAWQFYMSPTGYTRWLDRKMNAMFGPVIGGPLVRDFPVAPPIGVAGKWEEGWISAKVVVPAETVEAFGKYYQLP